MFCLLFLRNFGRCFTRPNLSYKTAEERKTEIRKVDKKFNLKLLVVKVFGNGKLVSRIAFALTKIRVETICQLLTVRRHIQII